MLWGLAYFALVVLFSLVIALVMCLVNLYFRCPPSGDRCLFTILPLSGSGEDMEAMVSFFTRYAENHSRHYIILLDQGLDEAGKACAGLLAAGEPQVYLCEGSRLYTLLDWLEHAVS